MKKRPMYLKALRQHLQESPTTPGVHHIEVRHDDNCGVFNSQPCDCEPEVEGGLRIDEKHGGSE